MDFQSAMETFAEAWVAANTGKLAPSLVSSLNCGAIESSQIYNTSSKGEMTSSVLQQQLGAAKGSLFANPTPTPKSINNNHHSQLGPGSARSPQENTAATAVSVSSSTSLSTGNSNFTQAHLTDPGGSQSHSHPHSGEFSLSSSSAGKLSQQLLTCTTSSSSCTTSPSGIDLSPTRRFKSLHHHQQQQRKLSQGVNPKDLKIAMAMDSPAMGGQHLPSVGKSMPTSVPIHCVIEVSRDLGKQDHQGGSGTTTLGCRTSPLGGTGGDVINVIKDCSDGLSGKVVEVDDFVIIPAGTPFQDVVTTVLSLLGYPKDIIRQAEGTISLRNWKPLRLDQVCDSPHKTVGDILNDLTNYATLRVLVTRAKGGATDDLKEKLLRLLLAQSSTLLLGAGCPLDELTLTQLVKGHWPQNLAEDVKRRFDQWYAVQHHNTVTGLVESLQQQHSHLSFGGHQLPPQLQSSGGIPGPPSVSSHNSTTNSNGSEMTMTVSPGIRRDGNGAHLLNGLSGGALLSSSLTSSSSTPHHIGSTAAHHHHSLLDSQSHSQHRQLDLLHRQSNKSPFMDDGIGEVNHHNHPVFHGLSAQKTRMRTSFDPEMELPKLQQWFADNPHPSRHQIQQYARELNLLDCRKDRKPLDVNNIVYWFKNARAAHKRNELRYNGIPGHHPSFSTSHLSHQQQLQLHAQYSQSSQLSVQSSRRSSSPGREDSDNAIHNSNNRVDSHRSSRIENGNDNSTSTCNSDQDGQEEFNESRESHLESKSLMLTDDRCSQSVVIKEEYDDDFISVEDVSLSAADRNGDGDDILGSRTNVEEPKDLSGKSPVTNIETDGDNNNKLTTDMSTADVTKDEAKPLEDDDDQDHDQESTSTSLSPRSSPGLSPNHHFDFGGPPSMVSRFHPFFDHPSFMAYRQFNSFNFGQNFPDSGANLDNSTSNNNSSPVSAAGVAYEAALCRKNLGLPIGKLTHGIGGGPLDIFHEFPHGLIPSHRALGHHDSLARLRGDEMFSPRSASSADIISSFINSNRGELSLSSLALGGSSSGQSSLALDERRKRNRTFIDPVTEVPRLEQWFGLNTHPSHNLILKYTDELNRMPYRQKFPKVECKSVGFWFKNRRAKCKRLKMTM